MDLDNKVYSSTLIDRFLVFLEVIKNKTGNSEIEVVVDIFVVSEAIKEEFGVVK